MSNELSWLLLIAGIGLFVLAVRLRHASGLPWGRVTTTDTSSWRRAETPLISRRFGLVGKPDYLVTTRVGVVPVEVKPGRAARKPYESDLMQLAAYCLLVEETTGQAPRYGLLRYAGETFKLLYTAEVRDELLAVLDEIRADRNATNVERSHEQAARCRSCGLFDECDERLG
jgi:CRISPR-associated exonuclease Cas4